MKKTGVVGAGSWGTALAKLLSDNGHSVTVYSAIASEIEMINTCHEQKEKLPGVILPEDMEFTSDIGAAVKGKDLVVLAVPSPFSKTHSH